MRYKNRHGKARVGRDAAFQNIFNSKKKEREKLNIKIKEENGSEWMMKKLDSLKKNKIERNREAKEI